MRILNNIDSNHFNEMKDLLKDADELHIISPFLMDSFDVFFNEIVAPSRVKSIVLITTLKDNDPDLFKKADSLYSFSVNCIRHSITFRVHVDNKLHGKIYIALKDGVPIRGVITSANFTDSGLNYNHEWGVQIEDVVSLKKIINDISNVSSHALTIEELHRIIEKIDDYTKNTGVPRTPKIGLEVSDLIKNKVPAHKSDLRYFIKPVGDSADPLPISRNLSSGIENMHFAKRPNSVRIGDILICYAVGTRKLLGYFEVISDPYIWDNQYRWPWELKARNLCPKYSEAWSSIDNTISSIQSTFDSNLRVTNVGGKTLGALQFGSDKIQLSDEFAQHVIKVIEEAIKN
jgi:HKD family nuclease